jgi:uncharacterized protein YfaS (alpha-2-macroglobulin family)
MDEPRSSRLGRGRGLVPAALTRLILCVAFIGGAALTSSTAHATTRAALRILSSTPAAGATEVPATGFISITFDRPMVTLNDVGVAGAHAAATISPSPRGEGRWISTATWTYQAAAGLQLATHYQVKVAAGLTAQDGSSLPGSYSFTFDTLRPGVVSVVPTQGTQYALPQDAVQVTFNQPVQRASAQGAFSLRVNGAPVEGTFSWNDKLIATQPNGAGAVVPSDPTAAPPTPNTVLTFHPSHLLPLGGSAQITIAASLLGQGGPLPMGAPYTATYRVAGPLTVTSSDPTEGATDVDAGQGLTFHLSAPLSQSKAQKAVSISPKPDYQYVYLNDAGTLLTVSGDFKPSTAYTITIGTQVIGTAGQALSAPFTLHFTTQAAAPSVSLVTQGQGAVYDAYLGANIYADVVNLPSITLSLYRLSADQFFHLMSHPPDKWQGAPPSGAPMVGSWSLPSAAKVNRTLLVRQPLTVAGKPVAPGYYLVDAAGGNAHDHLLVLVTRTAVTLKIGQQQAFVWATDLKTGKPVAGETVRVIDAKGHLWAAGSTNAAGVFQETVQGLKSDDSLAQHTIQAQLTHGTDVSAAGLDWNNGIGPWDYNLPYNSYVAPIRFYLTTERPIYKPGQPIYFKGIARRDNDGRYTAVPAGTPVQVQILDARQNMIYNSRLTVDAYGGFSGKVPLSPAASVGYYQISAAIGVSNTGDSFQVEQYKKPSYAVSVISDRGANANYTQGEKIGVQVRANYYFGAPLTNAPVTWDLTQDDYPFSSPLFPDYAFVDQDYAATQAQTYFGQQTTQGSGATDSHGDFHFTVPADISHYQLSQQYTLEATLTGPDAQQVTNNTQVVVNKASLYVGLKPGDFVGTAGKSAPVHVVTVSDDGLHTVAGVPVTAQIYKRVWLSSYVLDSSGFYYWQDKHKDTLVDTVTVHTDGQGKAVLNFTPKDGGEYRIVASAVDGAGRKAVTATELWVVSTGEAYVPWQTQNNDRITLVADKTTYKPGDTAHILVTAPLAGMTALVTVERGGVLTNKVVTFKSNSSQVDVPILGYYAPDVYVSVTVVKGPAKDTAIPVWRMGYVSLPVDTSGQSLHVAIQPSVSKAQPGQTVTYTIHTTNSTGQGVAAQLAVGLVDKAVLALAASSTPSLIDTFYSSRELGVESAATLNLYIDRLNLNQQVGAKGGSGGGGGGQGPTRQNFPDTAYWNPSVVTDAAGNAKVTIKLPDNLTTWTFTAIGGTLGTLVGEDSVDLVSTKDLLLEPALPSFLTVGDQAMSGAVVDNLTTVAQHVHVTLHTANGGAASDFHGTVDVPAGGSQLVQWPVSASKVGSQSFLFTAQSTTNASLGDRLQVSLPVQADNVPTVAAASGIFHGTVSQTITVPAGTTKGQGDLTITLSPSLVSGLGDAASYLANYPYDNSESAVSRFYGLIEVTRLPAAVSGVKPSVASSVPGAVQIALQRLYSYQNDDGGWGWWPFDDSSVPYVTAWVTDGLLLARSEGNTVDAGVLNKALANIRQWALNPTSTKSTDGNFTGYLSGSTFTYDLQAYVAYLLGQAGKPDSGLVGTLYTHRQNMLPFARAYLALAIAQVSNVHDPRVSTLLTGIEGAAQQFDNQTHWSDASPDWQMMEDDTSATSVILDALVRLDPGNTLSQGAARWLLARRSNGAWDSTQSTALALRALVDYAVRVQPAVGTGPYSVRVNGKTVGSGTITSANRGQAQTITVPISALAASNKVTIQQKGGGTLAYNIVLTTYAPITKSPAISHGIAVNRRYEAVGGSHGQAGSDLRVVLTITAPEDLYYLQIADPLPAGAEPVNPSLRTTSVLSSLTSQAVIPAGTTDLAWYANHVELLANQSTIFADYLPAGTYQYSYQIHLTSAGTYHALPTQAHELYFPDVYGQGTGQLYTIAAH